VTRKPSIIILSLILILILGTLSFSFTACWGSPTFKIIFENQSEHDLTIYINDNKVGNVIPTEQITATGIPWDTGKYRIKAVNTQGGIVFSKTLTREQMQRIESRVYKVVIKPLQSEQSKVSSLGIFQVE